MGLDTSHNCWHGPYSSFNQWRKAVAAAAGLPPLELMEGFETSRRPEWKGMPSIKWEVLRDNPLLELLNHSDCDGEIPFTSCKAMAERLNAIAHLMGDWASDTRQFASGLLLAANRNEKVEFH